MNNKAKCYLTPPEIAKQLRVSSPKVLGWIRRGELSAVNVSDTGFRPRYRVSQQSLDEFLESREVQLPTPRVRRKRQPPEGGPLDPELGEQLMKKKQGVKVNGKYYRVWDGIVLFY